MAPPLSDRATLIGPSTILLRWCGLADIMPPSVIPKGASMKSVLVCLLLLFLPACSGPSSSPPPTSATAAEWRAAVLTDLDAWEAKQAALPKDQRAYELNGDRLGMSLEGFKAKHYRIIPGESRDAPFCTDATPGIDHPRLLYKADFHKIGIVHGQTSYPFEYLKNKSKRPTIAGVPADVFVYKFIDRQLFEVIISCERVNYSTVLKAFEAEYGEPTAAQEDVAQTSDVAQFDHASHIWRNRVSSITLLERGIHPNTFTIALTHAELARIAAERIESSVLE